MTVLVGNTQFVSGDSTSIVSGHIQYYSFTAAESGTGTEMTVLFADGTGTSSLPIRLGVYSSSGILLGQTESFVKDVADEMEVTLPFLSSFDVVAGEIYRLTILPNTLHANMATDETLSTITRLNTDDGSPTAADPLPDDISTLNFDTSSRRPPVLYVTAGESATAQVAFTDGDPDTRLRDRDGNLVTAADVPIRVSTQRDPRGAPALTGAPVTMSITDGAATLDLSAADPMPTTGDAIYVEVFSEQATPEDDISRRYVLRMQDGAEAGG